MHKIILEIIVLLIMLSCVQQSERKFIVKVDTYPHYLLQTLQTKRPAFDVEYSYNSLNDSVILLKLYRYGDLNYKSIDFKQYNGGNKCDTLDYSKWYLCSGMSLKNNKSNYSTDFNLFEDECFVLDFIQDFEIEGKSYIISSFIIDHDDIDGDIRLYFNEELGLLAEYSHSGFDARLYWESNNLKLNNTRKKIITELIADTTFFPYPRELYNIPPSQ